MWGEILCSFWGKPFHWSLCKIPPGLPTAAQLWSSPCCSSGPQIMVPKVPNSSPPPPHFALPTLWPVHALGTAHFLAIFIGTRSLISLAAQSHPTTLFESTPACGRRIGSASTWRGAGSPVNAWLKAGTGTPGTLPHTGTALPGAMAHLRTKLRTSTCAHLTTLPVVHQFLGFLYPSALSCKHSLAEEGNSNEKKICLDLFSFYHS